MRLNALTPPPCVRPLGVLELESRLAPTAGQLDPDFGGGVVRVGLGSPVELHDTLTDSSRRTYLIGEAAGANATDFTVVRLRENGTRDPDFDTDGIAQIGFDLGGVFGDRDKALAGVLQSDGRLVVVGESYANDFRKLTVARLDANGKLDDSFDNDGMLVLPAQYGVSGLAVAMQGDQIIVATELSGKASVIRLFRDGGVDTSFGPLGANGLVTTDFGLVSNGGGAAVVVRGGGDPKIVVGGSVPASGATTTGHMGVIQLQPNGLRDSNFGDQGLAVAPGPLSNAGGPRSLLVDGNDRPVLVGGAGNDFAVARWTPTGVPDGSFDMDGFVTVGIDLGQEQKDEAKGVVLDGDRLVVGGTAQLTAGVGGASYQYAAVRLDKFGSLDTTFDGDGRASYPASGQGLGAVAIASAGEGRVVLAGNDSTTSNAAFVAMRLQGDGSLPPPNQFAPVIHPPTGVIVFAGSTTQPLTFMVYDYEDLYQPERIRVRAQSGDQRLLLNAGIRLEGTGEKRTVTLTAATGVFGSVTVELIATDSGGLESSATFSLTVSALPAVSPPPPPPTSPPPPPTSPPPPPPPPVTAAGFAFGGTEAQLTLPDGNSRSVPVPRAGGSLRTAAADLTRDGVPDLIVGDGPGAAGVRLFDGKTGNRLASIDPFEAAFTGGVFVAAVDLTEDGVPEVVVTPDRGGGPVVAVYDGVKLAAGQGDGSELARFYGIEDEAFRGGARAAGGDVDGDGKPELVVAAGFGGGPRVAVYDGRFVLAGGRVPRRLVPDFFVFEPTLRNGVFVAAGDLTADGAAEVVVGGGPGGGPRVFALDGKALVAGRQATAADFFAGDPNRRGGVRVAVRDGRLVTGSGEDEPAAVRVYSTSAARGGLAPDQFLDPFGGAVLADGVYVG